ncbi:polysaccharide deacetylase family protein [Geomesophilobacter sediminis]|uniref:NodB homology domain-containing protein n=1 Tax=Geomesophilobacter sediminis TaxID=2798584 RepID=A0A8J7IPB4_9BACT|nr:hypothetical protein [Geomesophilobacter sediminis]MBJ6725358.1 hypothetical protein [Geomesophilobacter sediminis]
MIIPLYYRVKPFLPRRLQIALRRWRAFRTLGRCGHFWPIDPQAGIPPEGWGGWPEKRRFALILTHDVDTDRGQEKCRHLLQLEESAGFRSSFNFVAARYLVSSELHDHLRGRGFEVGLHGLVHNATLYQSRETFLAHAELINIFLRHWGAVGFRSPCMYHNLEWLQELDIEYDASTFDTDPFEPQPEGVGTIFPFWVPGSGGRKGYVELPYTLPQDFTLFVLLRQRGIDLWKRKIDWIARCGGMVLLNTHPDYMCFEGAPGFEEYPASLYTELLDYVRSRYRGEYWHPLPREMARFWEKGGRLARAVPQGGDPGAASMRWDARNTGEA